MLQPAQNQAPSASLWSHIAAGGAALRHRNFRLFFFGQLISLTGTWMQSLAQQWLVFTLSHSALQLGIVSACQFLPVLFLSLNAGVIVERFPKRTIIVITQVLFLVFSGILGILVLTGTVQLWHVYVIAVIYGIINSFDVPARQAFMVDMVGRDDLLNGIALNSSIFNGARIFGPAIASLLIAHIGIALCFILNSASFIPVIIGLLMMQLTRRSTAINRKGNMAKQINEGLQYIFQHERLWIVFLLVSVVNVFGIPMYVTLMPIFATTVLHSDVSGLGLLNVGLGIGALTSAILLAYLPAGPSRSRLLLAASFLLGLMLIGFSLSRTLFVSAVALSAVGFAVVSINSSGNAIIQEATPDFLRGRVMSVWGLVLIGLTPFGSIFAGSLAQRLGAPTAVVIGSTVCLIAAVYINLRVHRNHSLTIEIEALPAIEEPLD